MTFEKLPRVSGPNQTLDMTTTIAVGFGCAGYSKDGNYLWQESEGDEYDDCPTAADVERLAKATETEHDWRIFFFGPLYNAEYQRQGEDLWVLVKSGKGFA